jgi:hypothetical protein
MADAHQLEDIRRAARRFVDIVENDLHLRWLYSTQFDAAHREAYTALIQALAASVHDRAMAQFNELRADAIQRIIP